MTVRGRLLVVASSDAMLAGVLAKVNATPGAVQAGTTYAARFRHDAERPLYRRLMRMIDSASVTAEAQDPNSPREPFLFSENIGGVSDVLSNVKTVDVRIREEGANLRQTVEYGMTQ